MVSAEGSGIRLFRFLIIAFSSILYKAWLEKIKFAVTFIHKLTICIAVYFHQRLQKQKKSS